MMSAKVRLILALAFSVHLNCTEGDLSRWYQAGIDAIDVADASNGVGIQESMLTRREFTVQWLYKMCEDLLNDQSKFKDSYIYRKVRTQFTEEDCTKIWQEARSLYIAEKMRVLK